MESIKVFITAQITFISGEYIENIRNARSLLCRECKATRTHPTYKKIKHLRLGTWFETFPSLYFSAFSKKKEFSYGPRLIRHTVFQTKIVFFWVYHY